MLDDWGRACVGGGPSGPLSLCLGCVPSSGSCSASDNPGLSHHVLSHVGLAVSFNIVSRKETHRQLIMINNEPSKPSLGFRVIIVSQQKWATKEKNRTNDGLDL